MLPEKNVLVSGFSAEIFSQILVILPKDKKNDWFSRTTLHNLEDE